MAKQKQLLYWGAAAATVAGLAALLAYLNGASEEQLKRFEQIATIFQPLGFILIGLIAAGIGVLTATRTTRAALAQQRLEDRRQVYGRFLSVATRTKVSIVELVVLSRQNLETRSRSLNEVRNKIDRNLDELIQCNDQVLLVASSSALARAAQRTYLVATELSTKILASVKSKERAWPPDAIKPLDDCLSEYLRRAKEQLGTQLEGDGVARLAQRCHTNNKRPKDSTSKEPFCSEMGRRIRGCLAGRLVEVTCRTIHGRFLLRPSARVNATIKGTLGRAQRRSAG